ncbi:hypothetical protein [Streptomyces sp. L2]|uniref:hypothetical protein n=1 Tax=Streptomyces sp. L2 TaxID=2162665 RepID=UPI001F5100E9|nr:hypothetical protein [Streptomyces sp. L2]
MSPHTPLLAPTPSGASIGSARGAAATSTGLMHRSHPWLGHLVTDSATGRRGILRAIAPEDTTPTPVAWLAPRRGGIEWTTAPENLTDPAPITPAGYPEGTA